MIKLTPDVRELVDVECSGVGRIEHEHEGGVGAESMRVKIQCLGGHLDCLVDGEACV
jgi:hypothetical protein